MEGFKMFKNCFAMKAAFASASLLSSLSITEAATIDPVNNEKLSVVKVTTAQPQLFAAGRLPTVQVYSSRLASPMTFHMSQPQRILPSVGVSFDVLFNNGNPYKIGTKVDLAAGKSYDFVLPQMMVEWSADDFAVELGPIPRFEVTQVGQAKPFYKARLSYPPEMYHKPGLPLVAGNYTVTQWPSVDLPKSHLISLAWGDFPKVALQPENVPARSTLHLRMTKSVSFPDAKYMATCAGPSAWATIGSTGYPSDEFLAAYDIPLSTPADIHQVRYYRKAYGTTHSLQINFGIIQKTVDIQPGATVEESIERLEVNKVKVVREDGSQYMADATYTVEYQNHDGQWLPYRHFPRACIGYGSTTFTAPSGIFLPKGSYRVTIAYRTDEGPKTQVHNVVL